MKEFLSSSLFFGVAISIMGYQVGIVLKKKFRSPIFNPLLISILFVMLVVKVLGISYDVYNEGAKYLSYLLTPATVCLAIPLYQQLDLLKKNKAALLAGIGAGVAASLGSILLMSITFDFTDEQCITLLPKSITTAIGMGLSEEMGGIVTITVASIIITGVLGNMLAETICRVFRITDPIARGAAIGTAAHAIGTTKAMEMGEVEGAMSSLAIAVAGLLTVVGMSIVVNFM
ncbi:MAG TPA: LrgB family protein [Candidatus Blautia gallistercoris]|uniref:LrgB family protein n=1 Tax=Candidatus Blautia gallistercoris TaxID=2838490 RepID=A0A9D2B476_9FIRM|nr:LrgB family protein [Candidatus Blautia gallistercoris]